MHTRDVCLATAVTDSFVPGAVVMLGSFRAHHPGFAGDIVILHDGLSKESVAPTAPAKPWGPIEGVEPVGR